MVYLLGYLFIAYVCRVIDSAVFGPGGYINYNRLDGGPSLFMCMIWPWYALLILIVNKRGDCRISLKYFKMVTPGYLGKKINNYFLKKKSIQNKMDNAWE